MDKKWVKVIIISIIIFIFIVSKIDFDDNVFSSRYFNILSSYENKDLEDDIIKYGKKHKINIDFTYMGDLDIVDELNSDTSYYDAVWLSNSIWLYMLDNSYKVSESKSISISPVVMGIKKSKAKELGLIDKDVYNNDILELIKNKKIKYVMSSVTQTNTGATAYLGFLNSLAGNPEVLTEEMLDDEKLINDMTGVFSGVERVSGDESYLEEMFINDDDYEAVLASESSLININSKLKKDGKEPLYLIYPKDGVAINDSTFGFIDNGESKKDDFMILRDFLLSEEEQKVLETYGRRTWYGGVNKKSSSKIFNPEWGINTSSYLSSTKYPSKKVMTKALNLYIEELRKPTHVVFCLDYSGSMQGYGIEELRDSMDYILDSEKASANKLQFSKKDKITVITFSDNVSNVWTTENGKDTGELIQNINYYSVGGATALYDAIIRGLKVLDNDSDDYTKTVIAMTDGAVNRGRYSDFTKYYDKVESKIPVYSISFGDSNWRELYNISSYTNAKVFDGKKGLLDAFKEVRGYN